jgi:hypothetical protein
MCGNANFIAGDGAGARWEDFLSRNGPTAARFRNCDCPCRGGTIYCVLTVFRVLFYRMGEQDDAMDVTALTKERIVALVIVVLNIVAALLFATVSPNLGILAAAAFGLSLPGLAMIWFREALSVTGFDRGVLHDSPPIFIDVIGWLFLVLLPVIFLYRLLP